MGRKPKIPSSFNNTIQSPEDNIIATQKSKDEVIITSDQLNMQKFEKAMYDLEKQEHTYYAYLNDVTIGTSNITDAILDELSNTPQNDLNKILKINSYVRKEINKNDLIGKTYEAIESNVNTKIDVIYRDFKNGRNKNKTNDRVKEIIKNFNDSIDIEGLVGKVVPMTFAEGNYIMYLRDDNEDYKIDYYPLGVAEISDYEYGGEPYVNINITELEARLRKIFNRKNKKGKSLYFDNVDAEIKSNFPKEIYEGYKNKEQYVKLNIENSGVVRINNLNRKYGVTSIFRALKSSLMIDSFKKSDESNNRARGKKIIFQKTNVNILGKEFEKLPYDKVKYSHMELMNSLSRGEISVYTGMPWVENIEYIEPKILPTEIKNIQSYRNEIANALGIGFTISDKTGVAEINLDQLMKTINKITKQLEKIIKKWYQKVLIRNNIDLTYTPDIKIIDSELLSTAMKLQLSDVIFSKFGASYETVYNMLDISFEQEKERRLNENNEGLENIFKPRLNAYNSNGSDLNNDDEGGRPQGTDKTKKDRQEYDKERQTDDGNT